ncbi:cytochrome P450 89A2-like [Hordeum vulgare subsp. vulgare]|uniref:cytochrome P450 89A2-like n=1 Tax=Hordeum vulgare subsp. vulgare TaxID=112509 RepID=UPI000294DE3A|nr:cytochrome P450 89A2-like [Hordeum vulgare subsp. vulgare]
MMQDVILLLFTLALVVVVGSLLRRALPIKQMQARLAAAKWALVRDFSAALRKDVVVMDRVTAQHLLVRGGAGGAFCNRPPTSAASSVLSRQRHHNIGSAPYGPLWRGIRRNLVSEVFHPSRLRLYAPARRRALCVLVADLREQRKSSNDGLVLAAESMHAAMFGLSAAMCFGGDVDPRLVRAMADGMEDLIRSLVGLRVFAALPALTELIYRERWNNLVTLRRQQEEMYLPLINARRRLRRRPSGEEAATYVDTLIDLFVPDYDSASGPKVPKQMLTDGELVGLCSEFLGAGAEPATAALQWIMANLVKHPDVQEAVRSEIDTVVRADAEEVSEEDLGKLEYLNAVLMETLRLHPTVPSVARQVMPDDHVFLHGRRLAAGTTVQFPLERLARDETAWAEPDRFLPERFLAGGGGNGVSLVAAAGSAGEIKMMPFGAGRRMCPGMGVAMLHLGYFVANLVREFEWTEAEGDLAVDLEPQVRFLNVMRRPLRALLKQRNKGSRASRGALRNHGLVLIV